MAIFNSYVKLPEGKSGNLIWMGMMGDPSDLTEKSGWLENILNEYNSPLFGMGVAYSRSLGNSWNLSLQEAIKRKPGIFCVFDCSACHLVVPPPNRQNMFFRGSVFVSLDQAFVVFVPCYYWCWTLKHMPFPCLRLWHFHPPLPGCVVPDGQPHHRLLSFGHGLEGLQGSRVTNNPNPMTDPWCCHRWCSMDPINVSPSHVSINIPYVHGSVMGIYPNMLWLMLGCISVRPMRGVASTWMNIGLVWMCCCSCSSLQECDFQGWP